MCNKQEQKELIQLLNSRSTALVEKDIDFFEQLLADDFCYINASGKMFDKDAYLEFFIKSGKMQWQSQILDNYKFRLYDDIAVVNCHIHDKASYEEFEFEGHFISTQIFLKHGSTWQYISGQTTAIE